MKTNFKKSVFGHKKCLPLLLCALIAVSVLTGCGEKNGGGGDIAQTSPTVVYTDIGEGETTFAFEITDDEGEIAGYTVHTDETTVGNALLAAGLIGGEESENGFFVDSVGGVTADYDTDKAYWAFYVDGGYASAGVDATDIEEGKIYGFVYTKE